MEFKEFLRVLKSQSKTFWGLWLGIVFLSLIALSLVPIKNEVVLSLDISRTAGSTEIQEYQYDQFYHLEADEKFAHTDRVG